MNRKCTICSDDRRSEIDSAIHAGRSLRLIAQGFGLGKDAIARHKKHTPVSDAMAPVQHETPAARHGESPPEQNADEFASEATKISERGWSLCNKAEGLGLLGVSVAALREVRNVAEYKAKLAGRLNDGARGPVSILNVLIMPKSAEAAELERARLEQFSWPRPPSIVSATPRARLDVSSGDKEE